jgi:thiamine-monophosphate kinase
MERNLIDWLRWRVSATPSLHLGIGDDAALWEPAAGTELVLTTDMLMDGVDFHVSQVPARRIGRKALAVNLSDLAAMAALPRLALVSVALPVQQGEALARELYEGLLELASDFQVVLAGGDTNSWHGPLVINVALVGEVPTGKAIRRRGAQPGDLILVTGEFGGSIQGHHLDFTPRVQEALLLRDRYDLHALTDVSDGLSLDLSHILAESGCGAELELAHIPIRAAARDCSQASGRSPLDHALGDGEDFELIMAVPPDAAARLLAEQPLEVPISQIGRIIAERGTWGIRNNGTRQPLSAAGWEHRFS